MTMDTPLTSHATRPLCNTCLSLPVFQIFRLGQLYTMLRPLREPVHSTAISVKTSPKKHLESKIEEINSPLQICEYDEITRNMQS